MMDHWVTVVPPDDRLATLEVEGIPLVLAQSEFGWRAFLDDCPDENLPMEPKVTRTGGIVCAQHGASFCVTSGCLLRLGNARHTNRCAAGLFKVEVRANDDRSIELFVSEELRERWANVQRRRFRKSFGRGPIAAVRYATAVLMGAPTTGRRFRS